MIFIFLHYLIPCSNSHFRLNLPHGVRTDARKLRYFLSCICKHFVPPIFPQQTHHKAFYVRDSPLGGLGVFARRRIVLEANNKLPYLSGFICAVSDSDFTFLCESRFPSLYASGSSHGILTGALSLVNNDCASVLSFTTPHTKNVRELKAQKRPAILGTVYIVAHQPITLEADQELLVQYGTDKLFDCNCEHCCSQKLLQRPPATKRPRHGTAIQVQETDITDTH